MEKQVLFMLMNLIPMMASAEVVEIDGIYFNVIPKGGVVEVVKHPEKYYGDVVIPESITFKPKIRNQFVLVFSRSHTAVSRCL